jgi:hypothetical protein
MSIISGFFSGARRGNIVVVGGGRYVVTHVVDCAHVEVRRTFGQWLRDTWRLWTWRRKP